MHAVALRRGDERADFVEAFRRQPALTAATLDDRLSGDIVHQVAEGAQHAHEIAVAAIGMHLIEGQSSGRSKFWKVFAKLVK